MSIQDAFYISFFINRNTICLGWQCAQLKYIPLPRLLYSYSDAMIPWGEAFRKADSDEKGTGMHIMLFLYSVWNGDAWKKSSHLATTRTRATC